MEKHENIFNRVLKTEHLQIFNIKKQIICYIYFKPQNVKYHTGWLHISFVSAAVLKGLKPSDTRAG